MSNAKPTCFDTLSVLCVYKVLAKELAKMCVVDQGRVEVDETEQEEEEPQDFLSSK